MVKSLGKELLLEIKGMKKSFGPTKALKGVDLNVYRGEIRGLIGENGSGKSTISSIIAGMQPCDSGEMIWKGEEYHPTDSIYAAKKGISMVVQEVGTVNECTIAENIFLGREKEFRKGLFVNRKMMNEKAKAALEKIGAKEIDPKRPALITSFEDKKLVEVARAIETDPDLLIVDETTTALSQKGRMIIYGLMNQLKQEGKAVLFISHDLEELMGICDELTVLRDGELIGSLSKEEMNEDVIKKMMVGREMGEHYYRDDWDGSCSDEVIMDVKDLTAGFVPELVSLQLHKGEILGIGGLSDSGMHDLGGALFGIFEALTGYVKVNGVEITSPQIAIQNKIGYVSKDRDAAALMLEAPIRDNIALPYYSHLKKGILISPSKVKQYSKAQIDALSIKCAGDIANVDSLSGGNKQKVSFAKWTGNGSEILILDCPTRGVDVGVKQAMYDFMYQCKLEGRSIIMISEELPELIGMSDRILIMKDGHITAEFQRSKDLSMETIVNYMI